MNGLFDPRREHDACGVGFVAYLDGQSRHDVMHMALGAMTRMAHRGGGDGKNGDGAGILFRPVGLCRALGRGPAFPAPGCGPAGVVPATLP